MLLTEEHVLNRRVVIFSILLAFLFISACGEGGDSETEITIDVERYANMKGTWLFRETLPDGKTKQIANEVVGTSTKFGYSVYLLQQFDADDNLLGTFYMNQDMTDGLYIVGASVGDQGEFKYNPPVAYLFRTFVPGRPYGFSYYTIDPNNVLDGDLTITMETVVVPAGGFADCFKSTFRVNMEGQLVTDEYWWAKDVGQVKHIDQNGKISELLSYIP